MDKRTETSKLNIQKAQETRKLKAQQKREENALKLAEEIKRRELDKQQEDNISEMSDEDNSSSSSEEEIVITKKKPQRQIRKKEEDSSLKDQVALLTQLITSQMHQKTAELNKTNKDATKVEKPEVIKKDFLDQKQLLLHTAASSILKFK